MKRKFRVGQVAVAVSPTGKALAACVIRGHRWAAAGPRRPAGWVYRVDMLDGRYRTIAEERLRRPFYE